MKKAKFFKSQFGTFQYAVIGTKLITITKDSLSISSNRCPSHNPSTFNEFSDVYQKFVASQNKTINKLIENV